MRIALFALLFGVAGVLFASCCPLAKAADCDCCVKPCPCNPALGHRSIDCKCYPCDCNSENASEIGFATNALTGKKSLAKVVTNVRTYTCCTPRILTLNGKKATAEEIQEWAANHVGCKVVVSDKFFDFYGGKVFEKSTPVAPVAPVSIPRLMPSPFPVFPSPCPDGRCPTNR